jgi:Putative Ig domain
LARQRVCLSYAGFVADSIAGLYQVNVTIPTPTALGNITTATQFPISVTSGGVTSQTGVTIWIQPELGMTGPSGNGLTGRVGVPWIQTNAVITASQGTGSYSYAITSGLLPTGLTLVPSGATVVIEGTPAANTAGQYVVTVTATDGTTPVPLSGSITFTVTVAGGLYLTSSGTAPYSSNFGTLAANITQVTASGGVYPYTYAITSPTSGNLPTGLAIDPNTGILSDNQLTQDGVYNVTVTATDSSGNSTTGVGSITFTLSIKPTLAITSTALYTSGSVSAVGTVTATGATGASFTYALGSGTPAYVTLSGNVVSVTSGAPSGNSITVNVIATDTNVPAGAASGGTATAVVTVADH